MRFVMGHAAAKVTQQPRSCSSPGHAAAKRPVKDPITAAQQDQPLARHTQLGRACGSSKPPVTADRDMTRGVRTSRRRAQPRRATTCQFEHGMRDQEGNVWLPVVKHAFEHIGSSITRIRRARVGAFRELAGRTFFRPLQRFLFV